MIEGMRGMRLTECLKEKILRAQCRNPVVLLGGPVGAYVEELRRLINAEFIVPEHADVGNAVGALVGKGIKRVEILIKTRLVPRTREEVPAGQEHCEAPESEVIREMLKEEKKNEFIVFSPSERKSLKHMLKPLSMPKSWGGSLLWIT
jgi:N-methylhydantoinase A/oxoprolinase/acetone carboxylase beta subunit